MLSDFAGRLGRLVVKADLTDPMSGFFIIKREAFSGAMRSLSGQGFKILLDLFASSPRPLAFAEVPLNFRPRLHGESKLDAMVAWEYLMLLLQKLVGPVFPVRFVLFSLIGALGVGTHLLTLWLAAFVFAASVPAGPGDRDSRGDDRQFPAQQSVHLSRPPAARQTADERADLVLRRVG